MSDENKMKEKVRTHRISEVVITPEDVKAAFEFFGQFNVPVTDEVREAFAKFQANPTVENQNDLKFMLTKVVSTTNHEAFTDESFAKVRNQCVNVSYEMGFERDFDNITGEDQ